MLISEVLRCVSRSATKSKQQKKPHKMPPHPDAQHKPKKPKPFNDPKPLNQS